MKHIKRSQSGFTLVEIAIVLVIIGLLLGGILKGQEMITNARVRNVADQQNGVKAAYFAFVDRYRALPGDYSTASANIANVVAGDNGSGDGVIAVAESVNAWNHLARAGFINCDVCIGATAGGTATTATPVNVYGGRLQMINNLVYASIPAATARTNFKSGNLIPSNIMAEVDVKIDDGNPLTGDLRFSTYAAAGAAPTLAACTVGAGTAAIWNRTTPNSNCGGANLL